MIVRYAKDGWEVITQRAHGLLAAQLAFHWQIKARPGRWVETLLAIAEHDDVEIELDGEELITPVGGPINYSMKNFDESRCGRLTMLTAVKSRYIALLVSLHMEFLYRDEAKTNDKARLFINEQKKTRKILQKGLGLSDKEIKNIYYLLEWCDALSLLICQGQMPPENRAVEISTGPDGKSYEMIQLDHNVLTVDPWPFESSHFTVGYEYRSIKQIVFKDSAEFRAAFREAPVTDMHWTIRKKPPRYKKRPKLP
jgi:hypothetical protein